MAFNRLILGLNRLKHGQKDSNMDFIDVQKVWLKTQAGARLCQAPQIKGLQTSQKQHLENSFLLTNIPKQKRKDVLTFA